jgi:hypothetical protein
MIKLKRLITESPDSIYIGGHRHSYTTPANRSAFFTYEDIKVDKYGYFGYSAIKKEFISNIPSVLEDLNKLLNDPDPNRRINDYYTVEEFKAKIQGIKNADTGCGHSKLETILGITGHGDYDSKYRARLFQVKDENNKDVTILTFWNDDLDGLRRDKAFWDEIVKTNGFDPKAIIYEHRSQMQTYEEFYGLTPTVNAQKVENEIEAEIKRKGGELTQASSDLHVKGATMSSAEKEKLKDKVLLLQIEMDILTKAQKEGKTQLSDVNLQNAILIAIHRKPKSTKELYAHLYTELEKAFPNMTFAQIRQTLQDKGINLKTMVKGLMKEYVICKNKLKR